MFHTLILGMGRAGAKLHLPVLSRVRLAHPELFAPGPIMAYDPFRPHYHAADVVVVHSMEEAATWAPPAQTVVHLCTPPHIRSGMIEQLARSGYRRIIVEKPLALGLVGLASIARVRRRYGLDITVATHWLHSGLTRRLLRCRDEGGFGRLRHIHVVQNKPRFTRSASVPGHPTAFDVEVPHALAVVLTLAGDATVTGASLSDMVTDRLRLPRLGRARLRLDHRSGVHSKIESNLTAPIRERRITLRFDHATLVGHYPCSDADNTAQLRITMHNRKQHSWSVFPDDALFSFLYGTYSRYARTDTVTNTLAVHVDTVRLLTVAKDLCSAGELATFPEEEAVHVHGVR